MPPADDDSAVGDSDADDAGASAGASARTSPTDAFIGSALSINVSTVDVVVGGGDDDATR